MLRQDHQHASINEEILKQLNDIKDALIDGIKSETQFCLTLSRIDSGLGQLNIEGHHANETFLKDFIRPVLDKIIIYKSKENTSDRIMKSIVRKILGLCCKVFLDFYLIDSLQIIKKILSLQIKLFVNKGSNPSSL